MKTRRLLTIRVGDDADEIDVLFESDLIATGRDPEAVKESFGDRAEWFNLHLRPATASREREILEKALEGDPMSGFRSNPLRLPGARVEVMLDGWSWKAGPSQAAQGDLPPNLASAVDIVIQMHLRPSIARNPDFLALLENGKKPSPSEETTSPDASNCSGSASEAALSLS